MMSLRPAEVSAMRTVASPDRAARHRLVAGLLLTTVMAVLAGLAAGSDGWSLAELWHLLQGDDAALIVGHIRLPRTVGAWLTGALLGLAGAIAQGLFRNPLADPYLLGSASGASLGVVLVLASGGVAGGALSPWVGPLGLVGAAFAGSVLGVSLTLSLARGAQHTTRLLLAGVVVGVVLASAADLVTTVSPEALRGRQSFMLGFTGFLGWRSCALLAVGLGLTLPLAGRLSRALDALTLGEDGARSLGLALPRIRLVLVLVLALATGLAVSQAGLVAFVGLVAPHLVRRFAPSAHGFLLVMSAVMGGTLLLAADVFARSLIAPQEVPVGVLTAVLGGGYLLWLLHRGRTT